METELLIALRDRIDPTKKIIEGPGGIAPANLYTAQELVYGWLKVNARGLASRKTGEEVLASLGSSVFGGHTAESVNTTLAQAWKKRKDIIRVWENVNGKHRFTYCVGLKDELNTLSKDNS